MTGIHICIIGIVGYLFYLAWALERFMKQFEEHLKWHVNNIKEDNE